MKYFEMNKRFVSNLQRAHDKFVNKGFDTFDEAYKVMSSYKTFQDLDDYVVDYIIDTIMELEGNEGTTYLVDDNKIVKIETDIKLIRAEDLKPGDIVLNYEYVLQVNEYMPGIQFNGTFQKTYRTELTVISVNKLNDKISTLLENNAHCIGKKYSYNEILEIKIQ